MVNFWYFIPKSGVAFIFISVIVIFIWSNYKNYLAHPFLTVVAVEVILLIVCFLIARWESQKIKND